MPGSPSPPLTTGLSGRVPPPRSASVTPSEYLTPTPLTALQDLQAQRQRCGDRVRASPEGRCEALKSPEITRLCTFFPFPRCLCDETLPGGRKRSLLGRMTCLLLRNKQDREGRGGEGECQRAGATCEALAACVWVETVSTAGSVGHWGLRQAKPKEGTCRAVAANRVPSEL